ncbi:GGDEF domain-containing protein [Levilactobacillus paucivorans]|uniref:GGDEF domain-containing protein n=1 Tax=Levilactobacillus paucivorans TaxID=616990 RepID=UPI0007092396|nr:GGDEF domain-containing protein [Levilactobacillus paucivorans]
MTWSHWQVPPFVTGVFFILGVLTLYWVTYNWLVSWVHQRRLKIADDVVFCAYFLNIRVSYYYFIPISLIYMLFNGSLGYWQSWAHAITLMTFFWVLNETRIKCHTKRDSILLYLLVTIPFGGLLWFWMKLKFNFSWIVFGQEWIYLLIFEVLLYLYVTMLAHDSELKVRLARFASHDALTQTENFAAYTDAMDDYFHRSRSDNQPLSMMMFDIDHFKQFNDTYGHSVGDLVLREVASTVQTVLDANPLPATFYRTGGEEFNVLFPGTEVGDVKPVVDEIFEAINHLEIQSGEHKFNVTISVGVSAVVRDDQSPMDFYNRVDRNLYHSKRHGRMRITVA